MRKMKKEVNITQKVRQVINSAMSAILVALGFASCSDSPWGGAVELYGTPTSSYHVKGLVTDESGQPVKGIKVSVKPDYSKAILPAIDSAYTDSKGQYVTQKNYGPGSPMFSRMIVIEDADGEANGGAFQNDTLREKDVELKKVAEGHGAWNEGEFEITANAKLKKK